MKKIFLFLYLFTALFFKLCADDSKPKVCLNMIVKNETAVIRRCLDSVKPLIDYWVIVDTGSTDGTQKLIKEHMKDVPGELHERPWVNFAHNRNEALQLAQGKGDYILLIDADEQLVFSPDFKLPVLNRDFYYIETELNGSVRYKRVQLVNNHLNWKWEGVLHEAIDTPQAKTADTLYHVTNVARPEGNRSQDPDKYKKDCAVLEAALEKEPDNKRYMFYLAQSYRDAGDMEKAVAAYQKRIEMRGWDQEVFWSILQTGLLKEALHYNAEEVIDSYKRAYTYRPTRMEPLYYLARYYRSLNDFEKGFKTASQGLTLKPSNDLLFVEKWIADYGLLLEYSVSAYWTGRYLEAFLASHLILANSSTPNYIRECVERNLAWIDQKIPPVAIP